MRLSQRSLDERTSLFFVVLPFEGLSGGPFGQTWARSVVKAVRAFNVEDEREPILHILGHANKEIIPIFFRHFGFATGAKPKYIPCRFLIRDRLRFLGRLLLWCPGIPVRLDRVVGSEETPIFGVSTALGVEWTPKTDLACENSQNWLFSGILG